LIIGTVHDEIILEAPEKVGKESLFPLRVSKNIHFKKGPLFCVRKMLVALNLEKETD
jgi:hypothetical protein